MAIIHVGIKTKTTLNRGRGGGLLFLFRGDGSRGQKLENRWNCLNSFVRGCSCVYYANTITMSSSKSTSARSKYGRALNLQLQ